MLFKCVNMRESVAARNRPVCTGNSCQASQLKHGYWFAFGLSAIPWSETWEPVHYRSCSLEPTKKGDESIWLPSPRV